MYVCMYVCICVCVCASSIPAVALVIATLLLMTPSVMLWTHSAPSGSTCVFISQMPSMSIHTSRQSGLFSEHPHLKDTHASHSCASVAKKIPNLQFAKLLAEAICLHWPSALVMLLPMTVLDFLKHHSRHSTWPIIICIVMDTIPHGQSSSAMTTPQSSNTIHCPVLCFALSSICVSCVCQFTCVHVLYRVYFV